MAAKLRINITVDPETVRLADREARRRKTSRSAVFRDAVRETAQNHRRQSGEAAQRERRRAAMEGIRRIAHKLGDWPAEQIVHNWRYRLHDHKP